LGGNDVNNYESTVDSVYCPPAYKNRYVGWEEQNSTPYLNSTYESKDAANIADFQHITVPQMLTRKLE
jgi:hypothetical protein